MKSIIIAITLLFALSFSDQAFARQHCYYVHNNAGAVDLQGMKCFNNRRSAAQARRQFQRSSHTRRDRRGTDGVAGYVADYEGRGTISSQIQTVSENRQTRTSQRASQRLERRQEQPYAGGVVATQILPHPTGCPVNIAFCGCGAAVEVFGAPIRALWLAAAWFKFPPAQPAPGMVAVRQHHVFVIKQVLGAGRVLAYDANSGGHKTRLHVRSLAGYSVRDPHRG